MAKFPIIIKNKFISTFIGSCGILMAHAFIFPVGNFSVYITSYIHLKQSFVTMHYGLFLNTIFTFSSVFGLSLGGLLEHKLGFKSTTLIGLFIILLGDLFFFKIQNIWLCYILTFIMGIGAGIANSLVGKNLAFFKPKAKGLLVSLISAVMVIFGGIFTTGGEKLISPSGYTLGVEEEFYPDNIAKRTYLYFMLGFIIIPLGAIIYLLFTVEYKIEKTNDTEVENDNNNEENKENKEKEEQNEDNPEEKNDENNPIKNQNEEEQAITEENNIETELTNMSKKRNLKQVFKTFRFWRLSFSLLFFAFSFSFILGTGRTFGALIGIDGSSLQFLMLLQSGALVIVGPILGFAEDKKGPLPIIRIAVFICIIPGVLLTFFTENTIIFISSFVISILGLVGSMVGFAPFIMEIYGIQESVIIGGLINVFSKISEIISIVSAFIISLFYSKEEIIKPYRIMYISGAIGCFISVILLLFENDKKFIYEEDDEEDKLGNLVEKGRFTVTSV